MSQAYTRQLRNDSSFILVPVTTILLTIPSLLMFTFTYAWYLAVVVIAAPVLGRIVWRLLKREKQRLAGDIFVSGNILLLTLILSQTWQPGSVLPYLYGVFIIISSTMIQPVASFFIWFWSTLLIVLGAFISNELTGTGFTSLMAPIGFNLVLALTSFLAAIDWQIAVEAVGILQRRAQARRDELFETQQELSQTNARLKFLNQELDLARQEAVNERDLRARFMNNVSHELRTPLNAIVNFAHILAQGGRGPVEKQQVDYLGRIEKSGFHLLAVLNDLLDLAQIESGEFKLHLETADLYPICEEAMTNARGLILDKDVELIRDYPDQWPLVRVDRMRLKQSLINLLGNAAKYTEEGHIALRVRPGDHTVQIIVEDTGIGIAPEHHKIIFQEFRQVDETTARRRIGTGLGLPITRHLIERHGGAITVAGALGQGSVFTITLPIVTSGTF